MLDIVRTSPITVPLLPCPHANGWLCCNNLLPVIKFALYIQKLKILSTYNIDAKIQIELIWKVASVHTLYEQSIYKYIKRVIINNVGSKAMF